MREEIIGDVRLILGNCLDIMPTLGTVDHVICDPPYETEYQSAKSRILRNDGTDWGTQKDFSETLGFEGISSIRKDFVHLVKDKATGWFLAFCIAEGVRIWRDGLQEIGGKYDTCMAWVKPDAAPRFNGQGPSRGFECIVSAYFGSGIKKWNGGGKRGVFTHLTNDPNREGTHPTEKPTALMRELVSLFTNPGELILDPFMGSGTTLVACAELGRKGIGIELNEKYFDIACKRVEQAYKQPRLFGEPMAKPKQEKMDLVLDKSAQPQ